MNRSTSGPIPLSPRQDPPPTASPDTNARMLIVGREIVVSGEINSCDCLIVEGTVKANVACNELRIAKGGVFVGSATVADAEIVGRFEGELKISRHLKLRAGGKIQATLRYREIEIERGGEISGDIQALDKAAAAAPARLSSA
jgi:cytoskeletal protein CcmA (bactofilin family)